MSTSRLISALRLTAIISLGVRFRAKFLLLSTMRRGVERTEGERRIIARPCAHRFSINQRKSEDRKMAFDFLCLCLAVTNASISAHPVENNKCHIQCDSYFRTEVSQFSAETNDGCRNAFAFVFVHFAPSLCLSLSFSGDGSAETVI